jgi:hypothetical protein
MGLAACQLDDPDTDALPLAAHAGFALAGRKAGASAYR